MSRTSLAREANTLVAPFRQKSTYLSLLVFIVLFVLLPLFILSFLERQELRTQAANTSVLGASDYCNPTFVDWHNDHVIDIKDYALFVSIVNNGTAPDYADLTCDGVIDEADIAQFTQVWQARQQ